MVARLQYHLAQEGALFRKDEFVVLGKMEIRHALGILPQPRAIGLVGREALEGDQRERDVVGTLMRHEIADQIAAASRDDGEPALGIFLELSALERIELVSDEYGDGHVRAPEFFPSLRATRSNPACLRGKIPDCVAVLVMTSLWLATYPLARLQCFGYHRSMKSGPDIAMVASLVGDPARADNVAALMNGRALTASELAQEAGISPQTASSHLAKLEAGGLIEPEKQGRHRYYRLTDDDVAGVLEGLAGLAARTGHMRVRTGPKDPALRRARICYDHLAGDLGVQMLDTLRAQNLVRQKKQEIELTAEGERFLAKHLQISPDMLAHPRRPVCKACLDWSERRHHLAGTLGAAMMQRFAELKWAARDATPGSRVVNFTRTGEKQFAALFGDGRD